jgi:SSS family solute:Na+ symporter
VPVGKRPVLAGLVAGELVVIWLTFVDTHLVGTVNVGLVGLGANVVVLALAVVVERLAVSASSKEAA